MLAVLATNRPVAFVDTPDKVKLPVLLMVAPLAICSPVAFCDTPSMVKRPPAVDEVFKLLPILIPTCVREVPRNSAIPLPTLMLPLPLILRPMMVSDVPLTTV